MNTVLGKIDEIEKSFKREQEYFVSINPIETRFGKQYEVFICNKNFKNHDGPLWSSTDYKIPFISPDINQVMSEATTWARFFQVEVDTSKITL